MKWKVPSSAPSLLVSETGRVVRMASSRRKGAGWQTYPEKELLPNRVGAGYLAVGYKLANKLHREYVHRLVAEVFLPSEPCKNEINHIDGDKTNNSVSNLEWVTHAQNHQHAARCGLSAKATLTPTQVIEIKQLLDKRIAIKAIADMYGVTYSAVSHIKHGRSWTHVLNNDFSVQGAKYV
jgi:hypothetical protein